VSGPVTSSLWSLASRKFFVRFVWPLPVFPSWYHHRDLDIVLNNCRDSSQEFASVMQHHAPVSNLQLWFLVDTRCHRAFKWLRCHSWRSICWYWCMLCDWISVASCSVQLQDPGYEHVATCMLCIPCITGTSSHGLSLISKKNASKIYSGLGHLGGRYSHWKGKSP